MFIIQQSEQIKELKAENTSLREFRSGVINAMNYDDDCDDEDLIDSIESMEEELIGECELKEQIRDLKAENEKLEKKTDYYDKFLTKMCEDETMEWNEWTDFVEKISYEDGKNLFGFEGSDDESDSDDEEELIGELEKIKNPNPTPIEIRNPFQFLRNKDSDAYLVLENMLLPISCQNRMENIHKSIRRPEWFQKESDVEWGNCDVEQWIKRVRNPMVNYEYSSRAQPRPVNIHGVMMKSERNYDYNGFYWHLRMYELKDDIGEKLKVLNVDVKKSWNKKKLYENLMQLDVLDE